MKAAMQYSPFDVRVVDVPEPVPGPGEIKVKIAYCGVCGSDYEIHAGTFPLMKTPAWPKSPFFRGHETSGTVVELGEGLLGGWEIGQRVAMNPASFCGVCHHCRNNKQHMCQRTVVRESGFSEYVVYHESAVYPLPEDVTLECGTLLEPTTVALHAVDLAGVAPGTTVAISGAGTIGLLALQIALRASARRVLVADPIPETPVSDADRSRTGNRSTHRGSCPDRPRTDRR